MPTLREKIQLNEAITGETKRCLAILKRTIGEISSLKLVYKEIIEQIIKEQPYIDFHPELKKRIPK